MFTFNFRIANADQLFGNGFLTDVYFDLHSNDSNICIATREELTQWIKKQTKAMSKDASDHLMHGDAESALMVYHTVVELLENLTVIEHLDNSIGGIIFNDGRLFKYEAS